MAVRAGHAVIVVVVAVPAEPRIIRVTIQAPAILFFDGSTRTRAEQRARRRALLAAPHAPGVISGRPMAGLALQLAVAEGARRVRRVGVSAAKQREYRLLVVTRQAGVCACAAVVGLLTTSRTDGQDRHHRCNDD